ncbi:hypothetical protein N9J88_04115 [Porticoccaceae bacterium]|nr:hypothetical protein [Porticoccaceae bacterium]
MGDIAGMILEGLLDKESGEYIGDKNIKNYGKESPGFPISYGSGSKPKRKHEKVECPQCNKRVKKAGLSMHVNSMHGE